MRAGSLHKPCGALAGLRVLEFAGLGPAPFACMMLADMGADVITLVRQGAHVDTYPPVIGRSRNVCEVDLKSKDSLESVFDLIRLSDVLIEGFRPGVMERLGLGPEQAMAANRRLVYGRMTGWGQTGPLAHLAGHDINYIALTGALHATGTRTAGPVQPLNLLGDYGGGSLYRLTGVLASLVERHTSGLGQVVDAAITDGVLSMMSLSSAQAVRGEFVEERQSNLLDGGTPWYGVYQTADGGHVSVGSLESQFFALLCEHLEIEPSLRDAQADPSRWHLLRVEFARKFFMKTRNEWAEIFGSSDACVTPVLTLSEAAKHPHHLSREAFIKVDGELIPAPAPRFSRTPSAVHGLASNMLGDLTAACRHWAP